MFNTSLMIVLERRYMMNLQRTNTNNLVVVEDSLGVLHREVLNSDRVGLFASKQFLRQIRLALLPVELFRIFYRKYDTIFDLLVYEAAIQFNFGGAFENDFDFIELYVLHLEDLEMVLRFKRVFVHHIVGIVV